MTLQEIARRANVSVATVSRTINRVPSVHPSLARRIHKIIEQEGYYPNTRARALVHGRSRSFGLMVSDIGSGYLPEMVQRFADLGVERGYEVLLTHIPQDPRRLEMAARRMIESRVDGVAILTFRRQDALVEALERLNMTLFVIDHHSPAALLKTVRIDYKHGIRLAVQHLAALGHIRIGYISGPRDLETAMARKAAFQECTEEIDLGISRELLIDGDHTLAAGLKGMSALMGLRERPSAVICSNDMTAVGAMQAAYELGLNIPRDVSIVGIEDSLLGQFTAPPLTAIQIPHIEIANIAFGALLDAVQGRDNGLSGEVDAIQTNLVLRISTTLAPNWAREAAWVPPARGQDKCAGPHRRSDSKSGFA